MDDNEENVYVELYLEGIFAIPKSEAKEVEKKVGSLITKLFKQHRAIKLNTQVAKYTEDELFMSVYQNIKGSGEYEN